MLSCVFAARPLPVSLRVGAWCAGPAQDSGEEACHVTLCDAGLAGSDGCGVVLCATESETLTGLLCAVCA